MKFLSANIAQLTPDEAIALTEGRGGYAGYEVDSNTLVMSLKIAKSLHDGITRANDLAGVLQQLTTDIVMNAATIINEGDLERGRALALRNCDEEIVPLATINAVNENSFQAVLARAKLNQAEGSENPMFVPITPADMTTLNEAELRLLSSVLAESVTRIGRLIAERNLGVNDAQVEKAFAQTTAEVDEREKPKRTYKRKTKAKPAKRARR